MRLSNEPKEIPMKKMMLAMFCTVLTACEAEVVVVHPGSTSTGDETGEGGSGGSEEATTTVSATVSSTSTSTGTPAPDCMVKCQVDKCGEDTDCYAFKQCFEDVQDDINAIHACQDEHPQGAGQWVIMVKCLCSAFDNGQCDSVPATFCTNYPYGHPAG